MNAHEQKAGIPVSKPGIFDFPEHPVRQETVIEREREQDIYPYEGEMENLFQVPLPAHQEQPAQGELPPPAVPAVLPPAEPPDIPEERPPVMIRRSPSTPMAAGRLRLG